MQRINHSMKMTRSRQSASRHTFATALTTPLLVAVLVLVSPTLANASLSAAVSNLMRSLYFRKAIPPADTEAESMKALIAAAAKLANNKRHYQHPDEGGSSFAAGLDPGKPEPFLTIQFGTADSPVPDGQYKDYGLPYAEHKALGISWGWNCDLDELDSAREREVGDNIYLRSFIIPDRRGKCHASAPIWSISLPAGNYTVKVRLVCESITS